MWELIRANKRNSVILMVTMAIVLVLMGLAIGLVAFGPEGAYFGVMIATAVWLVLTLISLASGDQILLAASGARPITRDVHPQLWNVVEEMKIAAGLPVMPKVYIINDASPNAFATGRSPETASVAVTAGLLARLNRDELQGVVAHEISHILHRDILYVTLAGIMLGGIVLLSQMLMRGMLWGGSGSHRRYSSDRGGSSQAHLVLALIAILVAILAPIMAQLLYFALSRQREYLADAGAARLTRYPEGLARALEKIAGDSAPQLASANDATAPMYIVNPFKKRGRTVTDLTSTHPPITERVRILRAMSQGVSYADYNRAFASVSHSHKGIVPPAALGEPGAKIRAGQTRPEVQQSPQREVHQVADIMRKVNGFTFLACPCGLNLKLPPDFLAPTLRCPRCRQELDVHSARPVAQGT